MHATPADELYAVHCITQVLLRYCTAVDTRRPELIAECFTEDARLDFAFMGSYTPAEYIALCAEVLPRLDATQHLIGPPLVEVRADTAHSRAYFIAQHVMNALAPQSSLVIGGWYEDQFQRIDGEWKIRHRQGLTLWSEGNAAVLGGDFPVGAAARSPLHEAPAWLRRLPAAPPPFA